MRTILLGLAFIASFGTGAAAAEPHPTAAVGVVGRGTGGCSGVLIRADLVLTAAHCVPHRTDAQAATALSFRLGTYTDTPNHLAQGRAFVVHPLYDPDAVILDERVAYDLAILQLAEPVPDEVARPIDLAEAPSETERLIVASYRGGAGLRARERSCPILANEPKVVVIGCDFRSGESGAPVLLKTETGIRVAAILTNRAQDGAQPLGFAAPARRARQLMALLPPGG